MKVINLFAGPGSGKSTIAAELFSIMKKSNISCELVTEFAKDLVWDGTLEDRAEQVEWIFAEQRHRIHRLRNQVDFAIVDSPLLLSNIYAPFNAAGIEAFKLFVHEVHKTYDNYNIFLCRNESDKFEESGRVHDFEQSTQKDNEIISLLDAYQYEYTKYYVDFDTANDIFNEMDILGYS